MKRMYIIVEAQGDWHSLSVSVLNRYSTNRASTMYIQMISYLYCNLIELYSKCIALILSMWYIGGSFGTRPCLVAYPTDYFWHRIQRIRRFRSAHQTGCITPAPEGMAVIRTRAVPNQEKEEVHTRARAARSVLYADSVLIPIP